jgi:hypothetical protein
MIARGVSEERTDYPYWLGIRADTWASWVLFALMVGLIAWWRLH